MLKEPFLCLVPEEAVGVRLDCFLVAALQGAGKPISRSTVQHWIKEGSVLIDGGTAYPSSKVKRGMSIVLNPAPPLLSQTVPEQGIQFDIVYQDEQVLVINKPAGLVVHPARGCFTGTLVQGLLAGGFFPSPFLEEHQHMSFLEGLRPGIVHRLDRGTSGLLVIARTAAAREHLKKQFSERTIERRYQAICVGQVLLKSIATCYGRHPVHRLKFTGRLQSGKRAVTHIIQREELCEGRATYITCKLETGRTHQIRVHLSEAGTPILGDALYGRTYSYPLLVALGEQLGHQALHAGTLGFVHPSTGQSMHFEVALPSDFFDALTQLRLEAHP
ncbi:RluA family pseudouridine synthase [Pajaroellobacter abortibovis]|uniref:Pseudouridine synthase n=1 Tax=Pajaroellobacter abortibovis TaxID=1882918 RepID=A0A1L6MZI4_9BACT|nr:RluA family pseudouridine synthase [Pajaroellobacter abortibovis]APS00919.1 hypothetical protein BCY86_06050 [Pajaroellobacter abortibovis]